MLPIFLSVVFAIFVGILWAIGISNMKEEHSDYKGDDFLK